MGLDAFAIILIVLVKVNFKYSVRTFFLKPNSEKLCDLFHTSIPA